MIAFDINAACTGFVYALSIAEQFLKAKTVKKALVIGSEVLSKLWIGKTVQRVFYLEMEQRATVVEYDDSIEHSFYLNSSGDEQGV